MTRLTAHARPLLYALLLALLLGAPACRRFTKAAADQEVYRILRAKRRAVPQVVGTLDIEAKERLADAIRRRERFRLGLKDALALATVASREYREQRENVYIAALDLTREINAFRPLAGAGGSADLLVDADGTSVDASGDVSLERAFETGGSIVFALATDFLRNITANPLRVAQTILSADLVLPLLRGSGRLVAREALRQAERDTLYALRDYARFQQEFTVDIATRFYRALQLRDSWQNAELAYESLKVLVAVQTKQAAAGRLPAFEVDQARQRFLEADDGRQRARNSYDNAVDQLKLDLGIPVGTDLELDDTELELLREAGPQPAPYRPEEALAIAQERRLDVRNVRDEEVDARRQVAIARDALRGQVDLRVSGDVSTSGQKSLDFLDPIPSGNVGLDVDLPLERTNERNDYRRALIDATRARRARERLEDLVTLEVRDAFRNLDEAAKSYEIQREGARLAERRVESTQMLLESPTGTATIRDRLDAEEDRVRARNAVTAALVDHALARLAVERDVGTLRVDAEGLWPDAPVGAEPPDEAVAGEGQGTAQAGPASTSRGTSADLGDPPGGAVPPPSPLPPAHPDTVGGR